MKKFKKGLGGVESVKAEAPAPAAAAPVKVTVPIPGARKRTYNPIHHLGDYAHPKGGRKKK